MKVVSRKIPAGDPRIRWWEVTAAVKTLSVSGEGQVRGEMRKNNCCDPVVL